MFYNEGYFMISVNPKNIAFLKNYFLNPISIEVDSPLLSTDRVDEKQASIRQFGYICVHFCSEESQDPLLEKVFTWSKENWQHCSYFFVPVWKREEDPYKVPSYFLFLRKWVLQKGGIDPTSSQKSATLKIIQMLKATGLPVSGGELLKQF